MANYKIVHDFARAVLRFCIEAKARLSGKKFYCTTLSGGVNGQHLAINSDLTVSCTCNDYDGSGILGDLQSNSLKDILLGATSSRFRQKLVNGKLPLINCSRCTDLKVVDKRDAGQYKELRGFPKFIMLENTVNCTLNCTACFREAVLKVRKKRQMSLEDMEKIARMIKEYEIENVYFINLGEPFMSPNVYEELKILRKFNPQLKYIGTSTNALCIDSEEKLKAAMLLNHINVSIDGIDNQTVQKYRKGGEFDKAYSTIKRLIEYRNSTKAAYPEIRWNYILFNWNDKKEMILQAIKMAKEAGVDSIMFSSTFRPIFGISWRWFLGSLNNAIESCNDNAKISIGKYRATVKFIYSSD